MFVAAVIAYTIIAGAMWGVMSYAAKKSNRTMPLHYYLILSAIWPVTIIAAMTVSIALGISRE